MSKYEKVFIRGWAQEKYFDRGSVLKMSINYDALVEQIKKWELPVSASGNIYFDVVKKKEPPQNEWESTHYLVFSKKIDGEEKQTMPYSATATEDLPF